MAARCPECNTELPYNDAKYCPECGLPQDPASETLTHNEQAILARVWDGETVLAGFYLVGADLTEAKLAGANLRSANLSLAKLSSADLTGAQLANAHLQWADLHWGLLNDVNMESADLLGAFLWVAKMKNANLMGVNLQRATLRDAQLTQADLSWANLSWADFSWADLRKADLGGVNLRGADLSSANMTDAYIGVATPEDSGPLPPTPEDMWAQIADWLEHAERMRNATLPNGETYDGRLNLPGDMERARNAGIDFENDEEMATFYGVSTETYLRGQAWAAEKLNHSRAAS